MSVRTNFDRILGKKSLNLHFFFRFASTCLSVLTERGILDLVVKELRYHGLLIHNLKINATYLNVPVLPKGMIVN